MPSSTLKTPFFFPSTTSASPTNFTNPNFSWIFPKPRNKNTGKLIFRSPISAGIHVSRSNTPCPSSCSTIFSETKPSVPTKLNRLILEFDSLLEPIDRVKRLLHYAAHLPPFDESARVQENRVTGCTADVWLEVKMDSDGSMRFRVDSDSEISKGFSSCLVWLLDGAAPAEVMAVKTEELAGLNVGFAGRTRSRVNTWHNVLISMQRRTRDLVEKIERGDDGMKCLEPLASLIVSSDAISLKA